jgi:hypothetical protein
LQQTKTQEENPEQRGERDQQAVDNLSSHAPSSDRAQRGTTAPDRSRRRSDVPSLVVALRSFVRDSNYETSVHAIFRPVTPSLRHAEGHDR